MTFVFKRGRGERPEQLQIFLSDSDFGNKFGSTLEVTRPGLLDQVMSNQCAFLVWQGNGISGIKEMWSVDILTKAFTLFKSFP